MQNLWRELRPGPKVPDIVYAIVEIPKGIAQQVRVQQRERRDRARSRPLLVAALPGRLRADPSHVLRRRRSAGHPADDQRADLPRAASSRRGRSGSSACWIAGVSDDKILAVPATDPLFAEYHDLNDVPPALPARGGALLRGLQGPGRHAHQAGGLGRRGRGEERDHAVDQAVRRPLRAARAVMEIVPGLHCLAGVGLGRQRVRVASAAASGRTARAAAEPITLRLRLPVAGAGAARQPASGWAARPGTGRDDRDHARRLRPLGRAGRTGRR